ncbi:DNA/RNA non-specific endonuclease [Streptomyces sp. NBC_01363]|uniref:DNA/RNA non-specific endonuclease n=1 Tax=Streptomyces sp. NBC_01363 TaxID=2903840 RepID=UPI0022533A09|nr:DNA/RNA non-specific endonuclease [Streptomyces sp. NBC_01363]MCX4734242.1 DNA/RNA non-specific endonuclease [Streptomyces sp. NBC_01363]
MTIMHAIRPGRPGRRRARSTVLALLTVVTLGLTTTGMSPAQQGAEEKPQRVGRLNSAYLPATTPLTETAAFRAESGEHCEPTQAGSKERQAGAAEACVSTSPATTTPQQSRAAVAAADTGTCDITNPGNYTYERFEYCVTGVNVLYILRDSTGKEIGRGTLQVSTSATLPAQGTVWQEQITAKMTSASGDVTALNAKFRASCTTGCTTTKTAPWYGGDLTLGQSVSGSVAYSSTPAANTAVEFTTSYKMYVTSPGATVVDPNASWDNPRKIRCDDAVGGTSSAGCAIPSIMPVVPMSATESDPGGAVAAYGWAQKNLNGAWGKKGSPLTRSTSGVADRTARTCGGFTAQTEIVDADSCGDFPFGEAKEGGAPGAQCVQVIPNLGNGEWDTYILNDAHEHDPASPCVQAHVTPTEKQFADTQLADGFKDQRVIDADQFELPISTPDTGPQASCLNDPPPAGSLPNGDGWFKNTTEPVPLVQQTIPTSGAGLRPTKAQACLGRATAKGSETSGDITGWLDAQAFKAANSPNSLLARCHLIANILGGKGTTKVTRFNLVPCWQSGMNTGTPSMRTFESKAQSLIKGPLADFGVNDAVLYEVTPVYKDANSTIPVGVTMNASIQRANGATEELFPNVYVTNTLGNTGTLNLGN